VRGTRESFDERTRAEDAAIHDARAFCRGPKSEHRLSGQMKDSIKSVNVSSFPRNKGPAACVARMATERHDIPTPRGGELRGPTTDEAGCPGDAQAHGQNVRCNQR
jgi:hypothetical protein